MEIRNNLRWRWDALSGEVLCFLARRSGRNYVSRKVRLWALHREPGRALVSASLRAP